MFQIAAIDHVVLRTTRLDDMLDFYCRVLGCALERETQPGIGLVQLRAGTALIDLVTVDGKLGQQGGAGPGEEGHNMDHFCLQLQPIPETDIRSHLEGHGVEVGEFAQRYGAEGLGQSLYLRDPEGNTVELRSRKIR